MDFESTTNRSNSDPDPSGLVWLRVVSVSRSHLLSGEGSNPVTSDRKPATRRTRPVLASLPVDAVKVFITVNANYYDMLRLRSVDRMCSIELLTVHGREHLDQALADGKGALSFIRAPWQLQRGREISGIRSAFVPPSLPNAYSRPGSSTTWSDCAARQESTSSRQDVKRFPQSSACCARTESCSLRATVTFRNRGSTSSSLVRQLLFRRGQRCWRCEPEQR